MKSEGAGGLTRGGESLLSLLAQAQKEARGSTRWESSCLQARRRHLSRTRWGRLRPKGKCIFVIAIHVDVHIGVLKLTRVIHWAASLRHLIVTPAKFYLNTLRCQAASKHSQRGYASEIGFYTAYVINTVTNIHFFKKKFTFSLWTRCHKPGLGYSQQEIARIKIRHREVPSSSRLWWVRSDQHFSSLQWNDI